MAATLLEKGAEYGKYIIDEVSKVPLFESLGAISPSNLMSFAKASIDFCQHQMCNPALESLSSETAVEAGFVLYTAGFATSCGNS